jgi:hypothetical protein
MRFFPLVVLLAACSNSGNGAQDSGTFPASQGDTGSASDSAPPFDTADSGGPVDTDDGPESSVWYYDGDGDGYGSADYTIESAEQPDGYVDNAYDCDDTSADVYPHAPELCDGLDNDCDGTADEEAPTWYQDSDGDGYGDESRSVQACDLDGYVTNAEDCDDSDSSVFPGADEYCDGVDNDCNGDVDDDARDAEIWFHDVDGDGTGDASDTVMACEPPDSTWVDNDDDCDDLDASIYEGAPEFCDDLDHDCDGSSDDADPGETRPWYLDADGDGYGDSTETFDGCEAPHWYVSNDLDCDDADAAINPTAEERCDGFDNDCDGDADSDATDRSVFYADADGDSYGDADETELVCEQPSGFVQNSQDCDDSSADVNPVAAEVCDNEDNDCNGLIDDDDADVTGQTYWFEDLDGDGQGNGAEGEYLCFAPSWPHSTSATDCDDTDAAIYLGAYEICDGLDNDCDSDVDSDDSNVIDEPTWYLDADGDSYGRALGMSVTCDQPAGYVADNTDCNDTDYDVNPAGTEVCDGIDNDCDGDVDDADSTVYSGQSTWYKDSDGDGYGDIDRTKYTCDVPAGYVAGNTDCDDGESSTHPNATEYCDNVDNDCDGSEDELDDVVDPIRWYLDGDDDGYGTTAYLERCEDDDPSTSSKPYVTNNDDCYDSNEDAFPGSTWYNKADRGDGSFDYDCDGRESKVYTTQAECDGALSTEQFETEGWVSSSDPACGTSSGYCTNSDTDDSCLGDTYWCDDKTQACN